MSVSNDLMPTIEKLTNLSNMFHMNKTKIQCVPYKKYFASSGNRTRAARVAGEHSTTEPTMLVDFVAMQQCSSCGRVVKATDSKSVSLWERRFESYQLRQRLFWMSHNYQFFRCCPWPAATDSSIV